MVDILHRVGVKTPTPEKVYDALTTVEGLAGWWTDDTTGSGEVGGVLEFRFPPVGGFDMEVLELRAAASGSPGGSSTGPRSGSGRRSTGSCARTATTRSCCSSTQGWRSRSSSCTTAAPSGRTFLMSLKSLVETGRGRAGAAGRADQRLALNCRYPALA